MRFFHELQEEMCGTATPVGCWQHQGNVRARPCILHYQTVSARAPNPDVHMVSQRCYQGHVGSLGSWLCMEERRAETAPWLGASAPTGEGLSPNALISVPWLRDSRPWGYRDRGAQPGATPMVATRVPRDLPGSDPHPACPWQAGRGWQATKGSLRLDLCLCVALAPRWGKISRASFQ